MVLSGLASKPVATVFSDLATKPMAMIFSDLVTIFCFSLDLIVCDWCFVQVVV
jgi:hypothetical protein